LLADLQKIILRCNSRGEAGALLFSRSDKVRSVKVSAPALKIWQVDGFDGSGDISLTEKVLGTELRYGMSDFFQVNVPVFEKAVEDIGRFVDGEKMVFDFFAGVGAISLPLSKKFVQGVLIESGYAASAMAQENITVNGIDNCRVEPGDADMNAEIFTAESTVIFDPPRAGLGEALLHSLIAKKPRRIVYLSCDLATQARDVGKLKDIYEIKFTRLYNFFPRTPHIEGLIILERK